MELTGKEIFFIQSVHRTDVYTGYKEHDDFQQGFGYGFLFGGSYNTRYGDGHGTGYYTGNNLDYPFELVQYWE